jgi:hypothetical protein
LKYFFLFVLLLLFFFFYFLSSVFYRTFIGPRKYSIFDYNNQYRIHYPGEADDTR